MGLFDFGGKYGATMSPMLTGMQPAPQAPVMQPGTAPTLAQQRSPWFKNPDVWGAIGRGLVAGHSGGMAMAGGMDAYRANGDINSTMRFLKNAGARDDELQLAAQDKGVRDLMLKRAFSKQQGAKKPSSIQEFEYGQANPAFNDWRRQNSKAGATNVTVGGGKYGPIPKGWQLIDGPEGAKMVPIPGGPAAAEQDNEARAAEAKQQTTERYGNVVIEDIDRAIAAIGDESAWFDGAGLDGKLLSGVPNTNAYKVARLIDTIKGNAGFDKLQQMRDSSPTGGTLGAVSKTEMDLLQAAIGSLDQAQDDETLVYNLQRVRQIYDQIINGTAGAAPTGNRTRSGIQWSID